MQLCNRLEILTYLANTTTKRIERPARARDLVLWSLRTHGCKAAACEHGSCGSRKRRMSAVGAAMAHA
eukprot:3513644-Lingulodinium_polyedra.AAC.1